MLGRDVPPLPSSLTFPTLATLQLGQVICKGDKSWTGQGWLCLHYPMLAVPLKQN